LLLPASGPGRGPMIAADSSKTPINDFRRFFALA
jgi:hypothetical protein